MLFNIDSDLGNSISGWLILDNPGELPVYNFTVPGRESYPFKANVFRRDLYDLGMHSTGMAGFLIDENMIPGLSEIDDFVLREAESGLPIYSRYDASAHLQQKLLMIDVGILPQIQTMQKFMSRFAMRYPMVDRYSLETIGGIFNRPYFQSTIVTGNVNWMRLASTIESSGFSVVSLLRDPFEELAEKFIFLKRLVDQPSNFVAAPMLKRYEILMNVIEEIELKSQKTILAAMRNLSREQRRLLRSPMTYAFGASPDDELQRRNVSTALDNLARFSTVGIRPRFEEFGRIVDNMLGCTVFGDLALQNLPYTDTLATQLKEIGIVCDLLDEDIALYSFVREAVEAIIDVKPSIGTKDSFGEQG